jgi:hypothetical protein
MTTVTPDYAHVVQLLTFNGAISFTILVFVLLIFIARK